MDKVLIDVGSSTVKVYKLTDGKLLPIETKSIHFKEDFDPAQGITESNKDILIEYINQLKKRSPGGIKIFATAIFRKFDEAARQDFGDEFFRRTDLFFYIVPHDLEGYYLEMALAGKNTLIDPLLLINIGGGSTELIVTRGTEVIDRHNLDIGVMTVLKDFPYINNATSEHVLADVVQGIQAKLPPTTLKTPIAMYNGGELTYMNLAGYKLELNTVLKDEDHPSMIRVQDFSKRNEQVFREVTLKSLEALMPNDPLWMHGARACSAIAQAICEHFGVGTIIPSDSNMVHGVVRQEFRTVVLSGSFRKHLEYILKVKKELAQKNIQILSPRFEEPKNPGEEFVVFDGEEGLSPLDLERYHLDMIDQCDALVICSPGGYVGASALIEFGYAQAKGKRIIFTEKPEEFMLGTLPAEVGL
ncbi:MAG TPA: hypothetical protein VLF60_02260 [Candidatus Saccharimonadales bacterium]|nr:hypothetical protein [Candidatus Saccharimonadales bacterium]